MVRRTEQDWLFLFKQQKQSGLSASAFCRQNNLCPKYFSKRKSDLAAKKKAPSTNHFIKVKPPQTIKTSVSSIKLQHQQTRLIFPTSVSPIWLAELIKSLA